MHVGERAFQTAKRASTEVCTGGVPEHVRAATGLEQSGQSGVGGVGGLGRHNRRQLRAAAESQILPTLGTLPAICSRCDGSQWRVCMEPSPIDWEWGLAKL